MKSIRFFLLLFLPAGLLTACLINQRQHGLLPEPQREPTHLLKLTAYIRCEKYPGDGESPSGNGRIVKVDGRLEYDPLKMSELGDSVIAHVHVWGSDDLELLEKFPVQLDSSGTTRFKKEIDFKASRYCDGFNVSFYSLDGYVIQHEGDFQNDGPLP